MSFLCPTPALCRRRLSQLTVAGRPGNRSVDVTIALSGFFLQIIVFLKFIGLVVEPNIGAGLV